MSDSATLNIHQVARAAGLTTSLLRVWESRYCWPSPRRLRNGYRIFSRHQLEEVVRAATLVRAGLAIGKLIVDGLPRWPAEPDRQQLAQPLTAARALRVPASAPAARLRAEVLDALERSHCGRIREQLQLAPLELRPHDELLGVLVPALVGLCELAQRGRRVADHQPLIQLIGDRSRQLLRQCRLQGPPVTVLATPAEAPLADLVAVVLAMRGCAVSRTHRVDDLVPVVVVETGGGLIAAGALERPGARVVVLPFGDAIALAQLIDPAVHPLTLIDRAAALAV
jgi:DNA-binding transcriptional MerR regulator